MTSMQQQLQQRRASRDSENADLAEDSRLSEEENAEESEFESEEAEDSPNDSEDGDAAPDEEVEEEAESDQEAAGQKTTGTGDLSVADLLEEIRALKQQVTQLGVQPVNQQTNPAGNRPQRVVPRPSKSLDEMSGQELVTFQRQLGQYDLQNFQDAVHENFQTHAKHTGAFVEQVLDAIFGDDPRWKATKEAMDDIRQGRAGDLSTALRLRRAERLESENARLNQYRAKGQKRDRKIKQRLGQAAPRPQAQPRRRESIRGAANPIQAFMARAGNGKAK